jgi:Fe2+ transport system protein FeoA
MSDLGSRTVTCPLCGNRFEPAALACHSACPLGSRCTLACCPNCGYEMPDASRSRVARWLRPGRRSGTRSPKGVPLTHVGAGVDVRIRSLDAMPAGRRARIEAFGIAPGGTVRLVQRRPVPVVRVGETDLAVGAEILDEILVEP